MPSKGEQEWKLWKIPAPYHTYVGHSGLTWETWPSLDLTQLQNFPHSLNVVSSRELQTKGGENEAN